MRTIVKANTIGLLMTMAFQTAEAKPEDQRLADPRIKEALMGSLLRLDDTQIRQRRGQHNPLYDACSGDGCQKRLPGGHPSLPLPLPLPYTNNLKGEWANIIHIFPSARAPWQPPGDAMIQLQDSNLFMVATTLFPFYLVDESQLPEDQRIVGSLKSSGLDNISQYRRGDAYSFWPSLPGSSSDAPRVGPLNIPMAIGNGQYLATLLPGTARRSENPAFTEWSSDLFNKSINPAGVDALANIPNDADDTALAVMTYALSSHFDGTPALDSAPLAAMTRWRDQGRTREDRRDDWKPTDSGGFLTWLKDESLPRSERFRSPETGVIPLGVNNVDCVVNANALTAFGLAGQGNDPAVLEAAQTLAIAAEKRAWPECGLYYPQRMMFPYAVSRAYRDGGVRTPELRAALKRVLLDLLRDRKDLARTSPSLKGAFPGGADLTYDLSTALALTTLLNIGRPLAVEVLSEKDYDLAIDDAVSFLLTRQKATKIMFPDTFNRTNDHQNFPSRSDDARYWQSGLFFSASKWSLAQWRSEAYTNAMVFEALTKYVLGWDNSDSTITSGKRLGIQRYSRNATEAKDSFQFVVLP